MSGSNDPDARKFSLWEIFNQLTNLVLWNKVRHLAIRGTVKNPDREPVVDGRKTAIAGLFELIERNDGQGVLAALTGAGHSELAHEVELMLKPYQQVPAFYTQVPPDPTPLST
jgi:hypothetical protein